MPNSKSLMSLLFLLKLYEMLLKADMSILDRNEFNSLLLGLIIFTILDSSVNNMLISLLTKELLIASLKPLETKK